MLRQPFGAARQHLNQSLARRRADQLQHVHLARLFAKMGYTEAALGGGEDRFRGLSPECVARSIAG